MEVEVTTMILTAAKRRFTVRNPSIAWQDRES
jgi:hypothetical protein